MLLSLLFRDGLRSLRVDRRGESEKNTIMKSMHQTTIPDETMAEMQAAAERAAKGTRDVERMKRARQSMDCIREEIRQEHGVLDIGVPAIRELRDE